jgi:6-pyruvoyltetrahydropterin/6-carboxytetrahydropterin synthase
MYHVRIRDHVMIAHSLPHPAFGPAQKKHGATYVIDVIFSAPALNEVNVVIDIALAHDVVQKVLKELNYQDLDELEVFKNKLTTTEYLAKHIHQELKGAVSDFFSGNIEVILGESNIAWAGYKESS